MEPETGCGYLIAGEYEKVMSFIGPEFAVVRADLVCGIRHLRQAAKLALMSHEGGYNFSKDKSTEVLLYLTGQRQISKALEIAGINSSTNEIAWVSFSKLPEDFSNSVKIKDLVISRDSFDYSVFNINKDFSLDLKQKIVLTKTAILPVQSR